MIRAYVVRRNPYFSRAKKPATVYLVRW